MDRRRSSPENRYNKNKRDFRDRDYDSSNGSNNRNRRSRSRDRSRDYGRSNNFRRSRSRSRGRDYRSRRSPDHRDQHREAMTNDHDDRLDRNYYRNSHEYGGNGGYPGGNGGNCGPDRRSDRMDRDRERDRGDRDREKRMPSSRDHDRSYNKRNYSPQPNNSNYDDDEDWDSQESDTGDRYTSATPNNKIVVRGLAQHITEADISSDLIQYGLKPLAIRLIRKRKTGASRGFAFVEFSTEEEAMRWMDYKQGILMLQDSYRAIMQYSVSKEVADSRMYALNKRENRDWYCAKCLVFNFRRRDNCFKCYASREESERGGEGSDEVSSVLTKKIILRNLDVLTNEEGVLTIMQDFIPGLVSKISKILICRDPLTNTSRGFCYLVFDNLVDSMNAHNALRSLEPPLSIEGREVAVSYCIDEESNPAANKPGRSSNAGQNPSNSRESNQHQNDGLDKKSNTGNQHQYTMADVERLAEYSASVYASNAVEHDHYLKYYTQYYMNQISQGQFANLPTMAQMQETANSGAAVAQTAIQRKQIAQAKYNAQQPVQIPKGNDGRKYPVPDVSLYQYDETSGYYYDPKTGLYYDAHSQYYYNNETNSYLYWDNENHTYVLAPTASFATATQSQQQGADQQSADAGDDKKKGEKAPDKVKVAKKIVKDMEKWAKQLNQKKEMGALQLPIPVKEEHPLRQASSSSAGTGYADVGFAILEKKKEEPPKPTLAPNKLVAAYGSDSDNDHEEQGNGKAPVNEKDYVDFEKLTCLLCKRAFQSLEILTKHLKMSNLHKENLAKYNLTHGVLDLGNSQSYRDRAKERRQKYGEADPPPINKSRERFQKELEKQKANSAASGASFNLAAPISESNMGNKLLQKMGWTEGQGLGRSNQGRTNIIEVESRQSTVGLGNKAAAFAPGDDYKSYIKRMMKSRYEQTDS